jgi:hypothetical protein
MQSSNRIDFSKLLCYITSHKERCRLFYSVSDCEEGHSLFSVLVCSLVLLLAITVHYTTLLCELIGKNAKGKQTWMKESFITTERY